MFETTLNDALNAHYLKTLLANQLAMKALERIDEIGDAWAIDNDFSHTDVLDEIARLADPFYDINEKHYKSDSALTWTQNLDGQWQQRPSHGPGSVADQADRESDRKRTRNSQE